MNHPFLDGNKLIGHVAADIFLIVNLLFTQGNNLLNT
ncbi:hypothetical protein [Trichocoleus desertorum]